MVFVRLEKLYSRSDGRIIELRKLSDNTIVMCVCSGTEKRENSMKNRFLPQTSKGKWSVSLFAAFLVLGIAGNRISNATVNAIEYPNPINSPLLGSVIYLAFTAAILASLMGILAVKKDQERSILVFLLIPIGLFFLVAIVGFMIANLIGPPD